MKPLKIMKKIDSLSIIINFDGYSPRAKKKTSKIESDVETAVRYAKNRGRYEKNAKKYAKNLGLRAMLYCGRPLKSQATEQSMRRFFGGPLLGRPSAGRCSGGLSMSVDILKNAVVLLKAVPHTKI